MRQKWALWLLTALLVILMFSFLYPRPAATPIQQVNDSIMGTYTGTLPCADCSGIYTTLKLDTNNAYSQTYVYQGKDVTATETGTYSVTDSVLTLVPNKNGSKQYLMVDGEKLQMLDSQKKPITGTPLPMVLIRQK